MRKLLKSSIFSVFFVTLAFSCSTTQRELASDRSATPCELDARHSNFSSLIQQLQTLRVLSVPEARRLMKLPTLELAKRSISALPSVYYETDALKRDFDSKIKQGKTLREMSRPKQGYAKIQSSRILWEELVESLRDYVRERLMVAKKAAIARPDDSSQILNNEASLIEKLVLDSARESTLDESLLRLSVSPVLEYLKLSTSYLMTCEEESEGEIYGSSSSSLHVYVEKFSKTPLTRAMLKSRRVSFGSSSFERAISALEIRVQDALEVVGRAPFSDPVPLYKPDPGIQGNIKGDRFPKGTWSVTFDDGPGAKTTAVLLDDLALLKTKATFFVLTEQIEKYPNLLERILSEGHALASHSYTHAKFTSLDSAGLKSELDDAVSVLSEKSGRKIEFFRLPYGAGVSVKSVRERIASLGLIHVFWNVDTLDWQDKNPDTIVERALTQMKNLGRGVILFHDIHPQSIKASRRVLEYILDPQNGMRHVTIPEIVSEQNKPLTTPSPSPSVPIPSS